MTVFSINGRGSLGESRVVYSSIVALRCLGIIFRVTNCYIAAVNNTSRTNDFMLGFYDYFYYLYSKSKNIIGSQKKRKGFMFKHSSGYQRCLIRARSKLSPPDDNGKGGVMFYSYVYAN